MCLLDSMTLPGRVIDHEFDLILHLVWVTIPQGISNLWSSFTLPQ